MPQPPKPNEEAAAAAVFVAIACYRYWEGIGVRRDEGMSSGSDCDQSIRRPPSNSLHVKAALTSSPPSFLRFPPLIHYGRRKRVERADYTSPTSHPPHHYSSLVESRVMIKSLT